MELLSFRTFVCLTFHSYIYLKTRKWHPVACLQLSLRVIDFSSDLDPRYISDSVIGYRISGLSDIAGGKINRYMYIIHSGFRVLTQSFSFNTPLLDVLRFSVGNHFFVSSDYELQKSFLVYLWQNFQSMSFIIFGTGSIESSEISNCFNGPTLLLVYETLWKMYNCISVINMSNKICLN